MDRDNFVIRLILRANDQMGPAMNAAKRHTQGFRDNLNRARGDMRRFDQSADTTTRGLGRLGSRLDQVRGKMNAIRGPTDSAGRSVRNLGRDTEKTGTALQRFDQRIHKNRESIAKFDNELRGMRILVIASQLQALSSAVVGLSTQLVALAGSAAVAASALGGVAAAAAAQAIPAIGLLAASVARLKSVFDTVQQVQDANKAAATQATSSTNKQADATDKLANASDGLRDAQQRVAEAQRGVAEAHREARREYEDLIMSQRRGRLETEASEERLRLMRARGVTGFALQGAELDVAENRVQQRRTRQDITRFRATGGENVQNAVRQLRDAEEALARSRRGMRNAHRDIAEGGATTVAAARQLDYMQANLTGAERRLVKSILNLQETWKRVSRPITDTIVNSFTRSVDRVEKVIQRPSLIGAFQNLADSAAKEMDRATGFLTSDRSIAFFERQTARLSENLRPASTAAIRLSSAFMNIADAAAPVLHRMFVDFAEFTGRIDRFTRDDDRMREIFEFGERHLHAWLRLAGAIGRLFVAIIAPGGNAGLGAAESGLRTVNFLIGEIEDAIRWINDNPTRVGEHFEESEVIFRRLWELLKEIAAIMLEIFDENSVDTFASAVELMLPAFQKAAEVFGWMTDKVVAFLSLPGVNFLFTNAFGLAVFLRLSGRFRAVFTGLIADITGFFLWIRRSQIGIVTMSTTTGGLVARWTAARAAVEAYAAAVGKAGAATAGTAAVAGAGAAGRRGGESTRAFQERQRLAAQGGAVPSGARAGALAGLAGGAAAGARFAGRAILPIGALLALMDFATTSGGVGNRLEGALRGGTFGQVGFRQRGADPRGGLLGMLDFGKPDNKLPDTFTKLQKAIREAVREQDIQRFFRLQKRLEAIGSGWSDDTQKAFDKLKRQVRTTAEDIKERLHGIDVRDIINPHTLRQALEMMKTLRTQGADSIKGLRKDMEMQANFIGLSLKKGTDGWRVAMVDGMSAGIDGLLLSMKQGRIGVKNGMEEMTRIARRQMRFIRGHMKDLSWEAQEALSQNFRTARVRAERQLGRLEDATGRSLKVLKRLMANELASYGFTSREVRSIIKAKTGEFGENYSRGSKSFQGTSDGIIDTGGATGGWAGRTFGAPIYKPTGGWIGMKGERGQDAIRTILGRGEAVLNWGHQKIVEPALRQAYGFGLDELFGRSKSRHAGTYMQQEGGYAGGGRIPIVPVPGFPGEMANRAILDEIKFVTKRFGLRLTDAYGPGHKSPGHTVYGTAADFSGPDRAMNAAVKFLARRYKVLYDGRFGSTSWPGHGPSTVAGANAHLHVEFGTKDLGMAAGNDKPFRVPRVEVTGAGPMGDIANVGLAKVRLAAQKAAQRAINRSLGAGVEGSEYGAGAAPPGQLRSWLRRALSITHLLTPGNLAALYGRAMQESGGDPRAINNWDSNAAKGTPSMGLLQTIRPTFDAYKMRGMGNIWNPIHNAVAAIRYMMATYGHIVGPSSTGYAAGGQIPGWPGQPRPILAHAGEWILNKGQQAKAAAMAGVSKSGLKNALGLRSGSGPFKEGGEFDPIFDQQEFLGNRLQPLNFGGLSRVVRALFRHMELLTKKGKDSFENINENLDQLTREDGLLDQLDVAIERTTATLATRTLRRLFNRRGSVVRSRLIGTNATMESFMARAELGSLRETGRQLRREDRIVSRGLGTIGREIRQIRRGGVDEDEEAELQDALTQRRALEERRRNIRGRRAENRQQRFEAQARLIEARLEAQMRPSVIAEQINNMNQRIAQAFGRGGQTGFIDAQMNILREQRPLIRAALEQASRQGNKQLADQLRQQMFDIDAQMAELTAQRLQAQMDDVEKRFGRFEVGLGLRERLLAARGAVGLAGGREQLFADRGTVLRAKRDELIALQAQARLDGNTGALETLTDQIAELGVQIEENSAALFQARVEDANRRTGVITSAANARIRIAELQRELGILTPEGAAAVSREQLGVSRTALEAQRAAYQQLLQEAQAAGNQEQIENLTQALLDNEIALLENSQQLQQINGTLNQPQSFTSTAWQMFRTAIFNGSGGLLPQFQVPGMASGGTLLSDGLIYAHAGERIIPATVTSGIGDTNLFVTSPTEVADPVTFAARFAWEKQNRGW